MATAVHAMAFHKLLKRAVPGAGRRSRSRRSERGAALLFALAAVLIIALLVFGVSFSATEDYTLAHTQMDAASALNTAEAGLTWEMVKLARLQFVPTSHPDTAAQ